MSRSDDGLREQDAEEFARLLQLALKSREIKGLLRSAGHAVDADRLRSEALRERARIAASAACEYRAFLRAAAATGVRAEAPRSRSTTCLSPNAADCSPSWPF